MPPRVYNKWLGRTATRPPPLSYNVRASAPRRRRQQLHALPVNMSMQTHILTHPYTLCARCAYAKVLPKGRWVWLVYRRHILLDACPSVCAPAPGPAVLGRCAHLDHRSGQAHGREQARREKVDRGRAQPQDNVPLQRRDLVDHLCVTRGPHQHQRADDAHVASRAPRTSRVDSASLGLSVPKNGSEKHAGKTRSINNRSRPGQDRCAASMAASWVADSGPGAATVAPCARAPPAAAAPVPGGTVVEAGAAEAEAGRVYGDGGPGRAHASTMRTSTTRACFNNDGSIPGAAASASTLPTTGSK
jgi:hypothetical protein